MCVYVCFFSQHSSVKSQLRVKRWIAQVRLADWNPTPLTLSEGHCARWGPSKVCHPHQEGHIISFINLLDWQHHVADNKKKNVVRTDFKWDSHQWWEKKNTNFGLYVRIQDCQTEMQYSAMLYNAKCLFWMDSNNKTLTQEYLTSHKHGDAQGKKKHFFVNGKQSQ